ncbi:alkyl/aryl-sulfatase [Stackebrandtia soli]|uniref:alkyl/aryl-sulfatase n=1 Tax=Stackebrandtia soli TaxID=1892856 RepID=UPI0039ECC53A
MRLSEKDAVDFDNADRGFVARLEPATVTADDGRVVWDVDEYGFIDGDAPDTVRPLLWRQGKLTAKHGLYEVAGCVYQVRGMDLSNMTIIEGDSGVIVVDPLVSKETAAASLALYRRERGDRSVVAVIYTHPHIDHFGGVEGVISIDDDVLILAPQHFMEHAVSENVYAGTAMMRRGMYFGGAMLDRSPTGRVGLGLGIETSPGTVGLIPPTVEITRTGQTETIDGVQFVFQLTPGTEAPAEMNFMLPDLGVLCMAENATHTLHNLLTLRGAQVRDARMWSRYLNEAIRMFGAQTDVVCASHHWPIWGRQNIVAFLAEQRDAYAYLHDQTLRMMNKGETGIEIAEDFELPPGLRDRAHVQGYYGSVSHGVKAIYQRYMGWYDGNPAHLWQHPPVEQGKRYVDCLGGTAAVVAKAAEYAAAGDLRFAAELAGHAVFADPDDRSARDTLADVLTRLGYGAECATWRHFFLTGAQELRHGVPETNIALASSLTPALSVTQVFDSIGIRVDGPRAWNESFTIDWHFTDLKEDYRMTLSNGALIHGPRNGEGDPTDLDVSLTKPQLLTILADGRLGDIEHRGDASVLTRLFSLLEDPDPNFAIVTP